MYVITKDYKRTFKNYTFASYDAARVFVRKQLRKRFPKNDVWGIWERCGWDYSNPTLSEFGYSIKKV